MRILLFGARGQLGQEILCRPTGRAFAICAPVRTDVDIVSLDQVDRLIAKARPTVVVNAAAYTQVDLAEAHPDIAFRENYLGPSVLAGLCCKHGIPLIQISTDYVFDGSKATPYIEDDAVAPLNVYGASKLAGEVAIRERLVEHLIIRTAWLYGRFGRNFLKTMLDLSDRPQLRVVSDQIGNPTATVDLADAVLTAATMASRGAARWGTYHFTGAGEASWYDFAAEIFATQARQGRSRPELTAIPTEAYPTPARRPKNSRLDSMAFVNFFGTRAKDWRQRTREIVCDFLEPR